jgi:hemerythrin
MTIIWNDEKFGTGVPELDEQHKEWLRQVNLFDAAVMNGRERDVIYDMLAYLIDYSIRHFALEESIMARCHCPALKENIAAHAALGSRLNEILRQIELSGPSAFVAISIKAELEHWLTNHICTVDVRLRDYVQQPDPHSPGVGAG